MKVYSTSHFRLYERDFEGNWDYFISSTPFPFDTIDGLLQLHYSERRAILEILEDSDGIVAIQLGDRVYGFEYVLEAQEEGMRHYRLLNANFEDPSSVSIQNIEKKKEDIRNRFVKKALLNKKED